MRYALSGAENYLVFMCYERHSKYEPITQAYAQGDWINLYSANALLSNGGDKVMLYPLHVYQ